MYRLLGHILCARVVDWAEKGQVLGELQNGFYPGRCLESNLFVEMQATEITAKKKRTLLLAFLDIAQAYDCGAFQAADDSQRVRHHAVPPNRGQGTTNTATE